MADVVTTIVTGLQQISAAEAAAQTAATNSATSAQQSSSSASSSAASAISAESASGTAQTAATQAAANAAAAASSASQASQTLSSKAPISVPQPLGSSVLPLVSALGAPVLWPQDDVIPELHLTNLLGNKTPKLVLAGDSTSTPDWPDGNGFMANPNGINPSQVMWNTVKTWFRNRNPRAAWNFDQGNPFTGNYGIGGMTFTHMLETGATLQASGVTLPSWWSDTSKTWLQMIQAYAPDVLVFDHGINFPQVGYGTTGGQNVLYEIGQILTQISAWAKVPNVIFITPKIMNQAIDGGTGSFAPAPQATYTGVQSAIRTLCRANGGLLTKGLHPRLSRLGLLDFGRAYDMLVRGIDPSNQFMKESSTYIANGLSVGVYGNTPTKLAETTDGDFSITLDFPAQGAGVMYAGGTSLLEIRLGDWSGQMVALVFGGASSLVVNYTPVYWTSANSVASAAITMAAGDLTVKITCKGERLTVVVNGSVALDVSVPRLINGGSIQIGTLSAVSAPATVNVTEFLDGFAVSVPTAVTEDYFFGGYGATQPTGGGVLGGNGANHPSSVGVALVDNQVMQAARLNAPVGNPFDQVQQTATPAAAATVQMADDTGGLVIEGSATLASLTVAPPAQPTPTQEVEIIFQIAVTALTWSAPSGYTISGAAPTSVTAGQKVRMRLVGTVWM